MSKYSYELKKQAVEAYINGEGGYVSLASKYGISDECILRRWVNSYKAYGNKGLQCSHKNKKYSFEFKLNVVELYLTTSVSYQELALSVGINSSPLIAKWVNDFRIAGPDALRPKSKGRQIKVDKSKENLQDADNISQNTKKYIKQLEDDLLKLRIENAYLKELRRLRLEGMPQNKKRELSTASEDHSN